MKIKLTIITAALALFVGTSLQATPISGSIDMSGTVFLNNVNLGSATGASSFQNVTVGGIPTGTYAGTAGATVAWSGFTWPSAVAVNPLWTFTALGKTFTFILNNVSVINQSSQFLNLSGNGILKATGSDNTAGSWSFTISNPTGSDHQNFAFTFANSQTAVPDGYMTVMLLGAALTVLCLVRKQVTA